MKTTRLSRFATFGWMAFLAGAAFFIHGCGTSESARLPVSAAITNAAVVPVPRLTPTNWLSRHRRFVAEAKQGGIDLLFLGDSITDNWRNRGSNVWNEYYASRRAANFGIGGDRTQHLLWRIENGELDGLSPKVVVIMIGTNNGNNDDAKSIRLGIASIVRAVHAKCPRSKILLLAVFPRNRPNDKPALMTTIRTVNDSIAKLADAKYARFLDIGGQFLGPDGKVPDYIMPDFLHPNERGYQIWAAAMEPALSEMLR